MLAVEMHPKVIKRGLRALNTLSSLRLMLQQAGSAAGTAGMAGTGFQDLSPESSAQAELKAQVEFESQRVTAHQEALVQRLLLGGKGVEERAEALRCLGLVLGSLLSAPHMAGTAMQRRLQSLSTTLDAFCAEVRPFCQCFDLCFCLCSMLCLQPLMGQSGGDSASSSITACITLTVSKPGLLLHAPLQFHALCADP